MQHAPGLTRSDVRARATVTQIMRAHLPKEKPVINAQRQKCGSAIHITITTTIKSFHILKSLTHSLPYVMHAHRATRDSKTQTEEVLIDNAYAALIVKTTTSRADFKEAIRVYTSFYLFSLSQTHSIFE